MVPPLPVISGRQAVKAFRNAGWRVDRQRGSHVILVRDGYDNILAVPQHRELKRGLLRALVRDAGLSVDEFVALL